jgi:hypothetical protein
MIWKQQRKLAALNAAKSFSLDSHGLLRGVARRRGRNFMQQFEMVIACHG